MRNLSQIVASLSLFSCDNRQRGRKALSPESQQVILESIEQCRILFDEAGGGWGIGEWARSVKTREKTTGLIYGSRKTSVGDV